MDDAPIRYGVIGTGMMGCEHIRNLRAGAGRRGHRDRRPRRAEPRLRDSSPPGARSRSTPTIASCCASAPVDAVVVATPELHPLPTCSQDVFAHGEARAGREAALHHRRGLPARRRAAERHPGVVWVGMEYRYMRPVARLVEEVHGGAVGRLRMLAIREHRFPFLPKVGDWNRFSRNTGGTLVEKCCHFFDLMHLVDAPAPLPRLRLGRAGREPPGRALRRRDARHPRQRLRRRRLRRRRARPPRPLHVRRELDERAGARRDGRPREGGGVPPRPPPRADAPRPARARDRRVRGRPAREGARRPPRLHLLRAPRVPRRDPKRRPAPRVARPTAPSPWRWASRPSAPRRSAARSRCASSGSSARRAAGAGARGALPRRLRGAAPS